MQVHTSAVAHRVSSHVFVQARQSLEKAKAVLEEERQNLTSELKSLQAGRTESERGRKRAESQLQELSARLAQADREREEREDRVHKLQVRMDANTLILNLTFICFVVHFLSVQIGVLDGCFELHRSRFWFCSKETLLYLFC